MEQWGGRKRGGIFAGGCIFAGSIFGGKRLRAPLSLAQTTTHHFLPPRFPFVLGSLALVLADWGLKNHSLRKCVCVKVASWQSESRRDFSRGRCVPFVIAIIVFAARCFHTPNICSG